MIASEGDEACPSRPRSPDGAEVIDALRCFCKAALWVALQSLAEIAGLWQVAPMIGNDGKPITKDQVRAAVATYNVESRGSKEFAGIPRALVTILDNLAVGKTTYVKGSDGQLQLNRRKDKSIVAG